MGRQRNGLARSRSAAFKRLKEIAAEHTYRTLRYLRGFATWVAVGLLLGVTGGLVGAAFSLSVRYANAFREAHSWIIWLLPLGGLLIAALYHAGKSKPTDTNGVLLAIHRPAAISILTGPVIFVSAVISHLLGGSVGREGAALQMGGVLGHILSRGFHVAEKETHVIVMCGMSAVFSAVFGAPLTAAVFAIEVASVGILHFSAIVPCLTASLSAAYVARSLGAAGESYALSYVHPFAIGSVSAVVGIAMACAVVSIIYCVALRQGARGMAKLMPNSYVRIAVGGAVIALLTWAIGSTDYNGGGMSLIAAAMNGVARPEAFALKLVFTVVTAASGYKGGEIVPAMFIGSTLGCVLAGLFGIDPGLGAAVGLLSLFCGSLNCPISSMFLGVELFGADNLHFFAIACAVSYMLSANYGLYREQKLIYSKLSAEYINQYTD